MRTSEHAKSIALRAGVFTLDKGQYSDMSPTIFREGPYRFLFFSREESRVHVHVTASQGEAKFWMERGLNWQRTMALVRGL